MAPRRPILYPQQYALAILTVVVLVASAGFALWVVFH
jgi:hypothetical protein